MNPYESGPKMTEPAFILFALKNQMPIPTMPSPTNGTDRQTGRRRYPPNIIFRNIAHTKKVKNKEAKNLWLKPMR